MSTPALPTPNERRQPASSRGEPAGCGLDAEAAPGRHGSALIMGDHLARSVRGISCAPPAAA